MRHRVYGRKLNRNKNQRSRLFKSLVSSLFTFGTITTSEAKAKAIKGMVDKIINLAKSKNSKQLLLSYFANKALEERLIKEIAPKLGNRNSGYTSLIRVGTQSGDQSMAVKMSLIGAEQLKPFEKVTSDRIQVTSKEKIKDVKKLAPRKKITIKKATAVRTTRKRVSK